MCQMRYTWTRRIESLWNMICVFFLFLPFCLFFHWRTFGSFLLKMAFRFSRSALAYGQVRTLAPLVTQQNRTRRGIVWRISCLIWIKQIETNERKCSRSSQVSSCYFYCILSFIKVFEHEWIKEIDKRFSLSSND